MLFVRNPTGVSHSPEEFADAGDCNTGAAALAEPGFLAEAERLAMPLRPLVGGAYAAMIAAMDASLRALWQRRPWKE